MLDFDLGPLAFLTDGTVAAMGTINRLNILPTLVMILWRRVGSESLSRENN